MRIVVPLLALMCEEPLERPNAVGIGIDGGVRSQRDENFNATRYVGGLGHLRLRYERIGPRDRHAVMLEGGAGAGSNRYDRAILWIDLAFRYAYQHRIVGEVVRFHLGGSAGGGPSMYQFGEEDADHVYWATSYDLALRSVVDWHTHDRRRRQHGLELELELPMLGLVSRPPEQITYNNDKPRFGYLLARSHHAPRLSSWHNLQSFRLAMWWSLRLSPLIEQRVGYTTEYTRIAFPGEVVAWSHRFVYRVDFRFAGRRPR